MPKPQLVRYPQAKNFLTNLVIENPEITNQEISDALFKAFGFKWQREAIAKLRKKLKLSSKYKSNSEGAGKISLTMPPSTLTTEQKVEWFCNQFKKSHLFLSLLQQFSPSEVESYLSEYGNLCCQFEDIVTSEFYQIDDFLRHRILVNRQLIAMKRIQEEIDIANEWLEKKYFNAHDLTPEDQKQIGFKYKSLESLYQQLNKAHERYDKLTAERDKIYDNLSATRKDRVSELRGGAETFLSLVTSIQASETERNRHGKYAELSRIAAEDIHKEFSKPIKFEDNTIGPIILDADTPPFDEREINDATQEV